MIVLISPAKTMKHKTYIGNIRVPFFMTKTTLIAQQYQKMSIEQLRLNYAASDKIVEQAYLNWQNFYVQPKTIALFAYQGEAFRNLDAMSLSRSEITKVNRHLRILSALYGLLRPLDEISLYRLDLSKNFPVLGNGVTYWRDVVTDKLIDEIQMSKHKIVVNCSSNEFTALIDIHRLQDVATWIQVNFDTMSGGNRMVVPMHAKAARGTLARQLCLRPITHIRQMNTYLSDHLCEIDAKNMVVTYIKVL